MNRIKELRKEKELKQIELSKILGVSQAALSGYETGNYQPDNDILIKLADFFDTTVDYILDNTDIKNPPSYEDAGLSADEAALLVDFRKLTDDQKAFVLQAVRAEAMRRAGEQKK